MTTEMHTEKFAGDVLQATLHGPDFLITINGKEFGVYTSIMAGIKAAREEITQRLEHSIVKGQ